MRGWGAWGGAAAAFGEGISWRCQLKRGSLNQEISVDYFGSHYFTTISRNWRYKRGIVKLVPETYALGLIESENAHTPILDICKSF